MLSPNSGVSPPGGVRTASTGFRTTRLQRLRGAQNWNVTPNAGSANQDNKKFFGVRCRGVEGERDLFLHYGDGVAEVQGVKVASGFLVTPTSGSDAVWRIRISITDGGAHFNVQINDGTVFTSVLPTADLSTAFNPICQWFGTTAKNLENYFGEWSAERDN